MYLYERGAHGASMIVDIMRYKGQHTKESHVFQQRVRLDFESFVNSFVLYLQNQSRMLGITLGVNIDDEKKKFQDWLKNNKGTYIDYFKDTVDSKTVNTQRVALIEMALYAQDEADALVKAVENIANARMAMKGGGIYIDKAGKPYSVNDPALDDIIKKERDIEREAEQENDK